MFVFSKNLSDFLLLFFFHILPHGPIKSPVFLFIIMLFFSVEGLWVIMTCIHAY